MTNQEPHTHIYGPCCSELTVALRAAQADIAALKERADIACHDCRQREEAAKTRAGEAESQVEALKAESKNWESKYFAAMRTLDKIDQGDL